MKFYDALTDFIFTEQKPEKADAIFVPGGLYGEIAQHAAELCITYRAFRKVQHCGRKIY